MTTVKRKCKVVMLSTEKAAEGQIYIHNKELRLLSKAFANAINNRRGDSNSSIKPQHFYILSDDEIKEGDWCIMLDSFGNVFSSPQQYLGEEKGHYLNKGHKKIIATTDTSLGLPQPSKQFINKFIEEYNKGNMITDVLVEYEQLYVDDNVIGGYKAKFRPKINPKDNTITITKCKDSWSREEVIFSIKKAVKDAFEDAKKSVLWSEQYPEKFANKWIEENL